MNSESLSHYRLLERIGSGGMGEVYRAQDTSLERTVALKLLPESAFTDQDRVRRFVQEAKAASALNHPNILTIHEIGEVDGRHFIAMEYVDGESLREKVSRGPLELKKFLDVAIQIADGLGAAHAAGIVHRDVKPENIMIRRDGYAKILDFGLAKLTEPGSGGQHAQSAGSPSKSGSPANGSAVPASSLSQALTQPGMVMGTAGYMSPEQARGEAIDHRSDIFSLGCVLYEMATGHRPFEAPSGIEVMHKIIKEQPATVREINPSLPSELQRIIRKSMVKDRDERYQSAREMAIDLRELRRELESGSGGNALEALSGTTPAATPARHGWSTGLLVGVFLTLVLISAGIYMFVGRLPKPGFTALKVTRLTATGTATWPAISSDGKYVAYLDGQGLSRAIHVKQVATGSMMKLVDSGDAVYGDLRFSPDSNWLLYTAGAEGARIRTLWHVATLGGTPRKLLDDVDSAVTFSPDGKRFAFVRQRYMEESLLMAISADGSGQPKVLSSSREGYFNDPRWSPDGSQMAVFFTPKSNPLGFRLAVMPATGGPMKTLGKTEWTGRTGLEWTPDGKNLIVCGSRDLLGVAQIWNVSLPAGEVRPITNDLDNHVGLGATANGRMLVTATNVRTSRISKAVLSGGSAEETGRQAVQLTQGTALSIWPSVSPDGQRIAYSSNEGNGMDIWIADAGGGNARQLTNDVAFDAFPQWSPEGKTIAYTSNKSGKLQIWVMDADGGNARMLTSGSLGLRAAWSPDARWLVYISVEEGLPVLMKIPATGGAAVSLRKGYGNSPQWSPDGKWILAMIQSGGAADEAPQWGLLDASSGEIARTWNTIKSEYGRWMPDGKAMTYINGAMNSIFMQPLEGDRPQTLLSLEKGQQLIGYDWYKDGRSLVCAIGTSTNDVVLIENYR
jgi:eukaryotic-like serine/threonine-protein kinase